MKSLVGIPLIFIGMIWSWNSTQKEEPVVFTHRMIQNELAIFISDYIKQKVSGSQPVEFQSMWTELLPSKQIRAHFRYRFETAAGESGEALTMKGFALLRPEKQDDSGNAASVATEWSLDHVEIENEVVDFKDGSRIETPKSAIKQ